MKRGGPRLLTYRKWPPSNPVEYGGLAYHREPSTGVRRMQRKCTPPCYVPAPDHPSQTHGHPSGYLSAGALASIVRNLLDGLEPAECATRSMEIARNWPGSDETITAMEHACELAGQRTTDRARAVAQLGEGWFGDEALAIGLYSVLVTSEFEDAVRVASNHGGDSDSTASMAGQIHGAWKGLAGIPHAWIRRLDALEPVLDVARRTIAAHGTR